MQTPQGSLGTLNRSYPTLQSPRAFVRMVTKEIDQRNSSPRITPLERRALASLKRDQSIIILPAEKGGATVVLDRDAHIQKAEQPLSDEPTYKLLQCDPTSIQVTSISKTIDRLVQEDTIARAYV